MGNARCISSTVVLRALRSYTPKRLTDSGVDTKTSELSGTKGIPLIVKGMLGNQGIYFKTSEPNHLTDLPCVIICEKDPPNE